MIVAYSNVHLGVPDSEQPMLDDQQGGGLPWLDELDQLMAKDDTSWANARAKKNGASAPQQASFGDLLDFLWDVAHNPPSLLDLALAAWVAWFKAGPGGGVGTPPRGSPLNDPTRYEQPATTQTSGGEPPVDTLQGLPPGSSAGSVILLNQLLQSFEAASAAAEATLYAVP